MGTVELYPNPQRLALRETGDKFKDWEERSLGARPPPPMIPAANVKTRSAVPTVSFPSESKEKA